MPIIDPSKLLGSIPEFLEALRIVRICPDKINAPSENLSVNILTLAIVIAIFALARLTVAGADRDLASNVLAIVVSAAVTFVTGFIVFIFDRQPTVDRARKWGAFFVMTWVISLLASVVIDGIPVWNNVPKTTTFAIDAIFPPASLSALAKDTMRSLIVGGIALSILLIKTKIADPEFRIVSRCAIATIGAGFLVNTAMLLAFLYGNVI